MLRLFKQSTPVTNRIAIIDTAKHSIFTTQFRIFTDLSHSIDTSKLL